MSLVSNLPITTSKVTLFNLRPAARSLILTNASTSAGNATFSTAAAQDGTHILTNTVVAPGASTTVNITNDSANEVGTSSLQVVAASTATVSAQSVPL